jgi:hypothetical protein
VELITTIKSVKIPAPGQETLLGGSFVVNGPDHNLQLSFLFLCLKNFNISSFFLLNPNLLLQTIFFFLGGKN